MPASASITRYSRSIACADGNNFAAGPGLGVKRIEANRIRINVRLGTGKLTEPADKPGLSIYAGQTFTAGGLGKYNADDLRRVLAGKTDADFR